jgi:hypothetical protein
MEQLQVKSDLAKLQQLLGSKLYSDKYSFIQEALQNSTDAMRKCGKADEPFDVNVYLKNSTYYFSIRDYGCSFDSIEEFKRLVGTLLESSKTQNKDSAENQELGKFGIGSIAVAAYNKTWDYKVYKNGKVFDAKLQEIDGQGLFMEVSDYYDTAEVDGVFLQIQIIDSLEMFVNKLLEKAKYFQNIKFNFDADVIYSLRYSNFNSRLVTINKDFQIFKSDDFQYSTLNKSSKIHICLDQYAYEIKWDELEIDAVNLPLALRFNLNDFETNPTREVLTITPDYKEKIVAKLEKVADWFVDKWNEVNPMRECNNLNDYIDELEKRQNKHVSLANTNLDVFLFCNLYSLKTFNTVTFKNISAGTLNGFNRFLNRYSYYFYEGFATIRHGNLSRHAGYIGRHDCYFIKKSFSRTYQTYFKTVLRNSDSRIYKKKPVEFVFSNPQENQVSFLKYMENFEKVKIDALTKENIEALTKMFSDFKTLMVEFEKCIPNVEDIVPLNYGNTIPKVQRRKSKIDKGDDEIILKYPREPQKWINWSAVWEDKAVKVNELKKLKALHIYGTESRRRDIEQIFTFTKKIQTIMVNDKIEKVIKDENPQNFIHIDNLKERFTVLANYFTALYIKEQMIGYRFLFDNVDKIQKYISATIANDITELKMLMSRYNVDNKVDESGIIKELYDLYKDNPKLYNQEHVNIFNKVDKIKENLDFLQLFADDLVNVNSQYTHKKIKADLALKTMREVLRARKVRMNWENYNLDKVEDFKPIIIEPQLECEI